MIPILLFRHSDLDFSTNPPHTIILPYTPQPSNNITQATTSNTSSDISPAHPHQIIKAPRKRKNKRSNAKRKLEQLSWQRNLETNAITNLSSYEPTPPEQQLLTKGLSYIPSYNSNTTTLQEHTNTFVKRLRTDYFFRDSPRTTPQFHTKSDWVPPTPHNLQLTKLTNEIQTISSTTQFCHSDNTEQQSILSLTNNKDITIKRADKGGSVVIMNTQDYIDTALTHLNQPNVYQPHDTDPTQDIADRLNSFILQLTNTGHLKHVIAKYIQPKLPPRTPLFYFLPKIHKPNNPPRPIISGCDAPTDNLSKYLTAVFNPIAQAQPSYLKDTKHLLQLIENHPHLPKNATLCTADVTSLYTNIPHDEGISVILEALKTHKHLLPMHTPNNTIIKTFLHFILKENHFDFLDKHYLQTQGTAMGTKMAPPYANIFMAQIEQQIKHNYNQHISLWKRFIDDIFFIWQGSHKSLEQFTQHSNTHHDSIKFTFEHSQSEIHFLDTRIYIDKSRKLQTNIYRKPTDKNLILHFSSHHPLHLKRNIVYTQALRYKRIISSPHNLTIELKTLKKIFLARGYPQRLIEQQINKAKLIPRALLLTDTIKQPPPKKTLFKIPYHPDSSTLKKRIRHTWHNTLTDPPLRKLWPSPPTFLDHTNRNLKDLLVHTRQHLPSTPNTNAMNPDIV
jgi:peptide-methionine (R)-S-oxide reductase